MEITLKFRVEILFIILIIWFILCGHLFCSCFKEGFQLTNNRMINTTTSKFKV